MTSETKQKPLIPELKTLITEVLLPRSSSTVWRDSDDWLDQTAAPQQGQAYLERIYHILSSGKKVAPED